jgi:hypothetical protein
MKSMLLVFKNPLSNFGHQGTKAQEGQRKIKKRITALKKMYLHFFFKIGMI